MGYHRAGFDVVGVDINPQPRYPFEFHQSDALEYLAAHWSEFDAVHASPPCQRYCPLSALPSTRSAEEHPDLVGVTRDALRATGLPYVIENVPTAPLDKARSVMLCGEMFGLRTVRHRRFEPSPCFTLAAPPWCGGRHRVPTATVRRRERWAQGWNVSITGDVGVYVGPEAMGIDWMNGDELSEAIPPAYTEHVGGQLLTHLATTERAA